MEFKNNYSLTRSFLTKSVTISFSDNDDDDNSSPNFSSFDINLPTVSDFIDNENWLVLYSIINKPLSELEKMFPIIEVTSPYDAICFIEQHISLMDYFDLGIKLKFGMQLIFGDNCYWDTKIKRFVIQQSEAMSITITSQICDYVTDVIKLSCGKSITPQITPKTDAARKFFAAQKKMQEQIDAIKAKNNSSTAETDDIIKTFLRITYSFPSLDIDYLFNQTLAQIHWLVNYAAKSVSYQVKSQAYAAGNMKKGSKLDFFI